MHRWTVEGAHRTSGRELVESIEAATEEEARAEAGRRGILISSLRPSLAETDGIGSPSGTQRHLSYPAPQALPPRVPPIYQEIVKGEKWLGTFASILTAFGWVCAMGGVVSAAIVFEALFQAKQMDRMDMFGRLGLGTSSLGAFIIATVMFLGAAALLRFIGSVGLAVRDMARNSF